ITRAAEHGNEQEQMVRLTEKIAQMERQFETLLESMETMTKNVIKMNAKPELMEAYETFKRDLD
ncbi:hypothetical protein Ciccas_012879, partial [Cichlidogyrus casuarinus]